MYQQLCVEGKEKKNGNGNNASGLHVHLINLIRWYFDTIGTAFSRIIRAKRNIWKQGLFLCAVGLVYGGGHLSTWNNFFPSPTEQYMWKVCSIVTAVAVSSDVYFPPHRQY